MNNQHLEKQALAFLFEKNFPNKVRKLGHALLKIRDNDWKQKDADNLAKEALQLNDIANKAGNKNIMDLTNQVTQELTQLQKSGKIPSKETLTIIEGQIDILLKNVDFHKQIEPEALKPPKNKLYHSKILISTTYKTVAQDLQSQFTYFGYRADICPSFKSIEIKLAGEPFPLAFAAIILDIDVCKNQKLEQFDSFPADIPKIFISKEDNLQARLFAVRAGGKAFFKLPLEFHKLIEKIDDLIKPKSENSPYRILMVEDSKVQANLYKKALTEAGMIVEALTEASQINNRLKEFQPELILMDLYMPNYTGLELAAVIRQQDVYVGVPIVFLSSENNIATQLDAMRLGGDDFLTKPIELKHLISAVTTRVERARSLRSEMIQDSLTGLLNHSRILEQLNLEIARAKRDNTPLSFAMIDIDNFKSINDNYGHLVGDAVIKSLARLLKQRFRKTDSIGRYGGEEYAVIFPNSTTEQMLPLLEDIRISFAKIKHHTKENPRYFNVTFSAGVACYSPDMNTADKLIETADKALYAAKHNGRNQVVIYPDLPTTSSSQSK